MDAQYVTTFHGYLTEGHMVKLKITKATRVWFLATRNEKAKTVCYFCKMIDPWIFSLKYRVIQHKICEKMLHVDVSENDTPYDFR